MTHEEWREEEVERLLGDDEWLSPSWRKRKFGYSGEAGISWSESVYLDMMDWEKSGVSWMVIYPAPGFLESEEGVLLAFVSWDEEQGWWYDQKNDKGRSSVEGER